MLGLPGAGKTTYLAALFHLLRADDGLPTALRLQRLPDEREYFLGIERTWLALEPIEHSVHPEPEDTRLKLEGEGEERFEVLIPDVSGEAFNELWERGTWRESVADFVAVADGLLLFVRSDDVRQPDVLEVLEGEDDVIVDHQAEESIAASGRLPWKPEDAPTQTKLADLLESIDSVRGRVPVAVLVSAWDAKEPSGVAPHDWLELTLPLLWQMLTAGEDERAYRTFGVSAQGGDVRIPRDRQELAGRKNPAVRILVQDGDSTSSDLTAPLTWLLRPPP